MQWFKERILHRRDARTEAAVRQFEIDLAYFERAMSTWKRGKGNDEPPPEKPDPPKAARCIVSDTTVEALAPLFSTNPRGLLLSRDELAGWIGSFDKYSGKGGGDASQWLSMYNGGSIMVDRKSGTPPTIYVERASVSVVGGIQPGILNRDLGQEHRESGLAARLLLTWPPRTPKRWTEDDIDPAGVAKLARLVDRLYELQPTFNEDGEPSPTEVMLAPGAKEAWKKFYNRHAKEQAELGGDLAAAWSKLEEYPARLALVIHCTRWAARDSEPHTRRAWPCCSTRESPNACALH